MWPLYVLINSQQKSRKKNYSNIYPSGETERVRNLWWTAVVGIIYENNPNETKCERTYYFIPSLSTHVPTIL